ncbi:MAG: hypothetical protein H7124_01710 [Phycisphaerales bacterium]|nr:hypothetical protein [Hyphomonadaceae bacterium]
MFIVLGDDGPLAFSSIEHIGDWLEAQRMAWSWIGDRAPTLRPFRDAWGRYNSFFASIENAVAPYHSDGARENLQSRIQEVFNRHIHTGLVAITGTKRGATIQALLDKLGGAQSEDAASRALRAMTHMGPAQDNVNLNPAYVKEMTLSILDYQSVSSSAFAQSAATQQAIVTANNELTKRQQSLDQLYIATEQRIAAWETSLNSTTSENSERASAAIESLNQVKQTFETQMGLQAPAQYWSTKAAVHAASADRYRRRLIGWGGFFVLSTIAAYALVLWLVVDKEIGSQNQLAAGILFFGALAVWTTGALWAARLMSRLYLSEHHLGVDAAERATMATTYLALTSQGSADEKDRAVVLAALFRPTADGIVKDDPPPMLTPAAFLAGLATPHR